MDTCPLCRSDQTQDLHETHSELRYVHCVTCDMRFLKPSLRLDLENEKKRYLLHENHYSDDGYVKFLKPIIDELSACVPKGGCGLDFGAGPGPVLARLLEESGFKVSIYDPFFWPSKEPLSHRYNFVVATEVIEHFYNPWKEFKLLKDLLDSRGVLALMTALYSEDIDFQSWHYRRDPTHVCFYSRKTFEWIHASLGFSKLKIEGNRTILLFK